MWPSQNIYEVLKSHFNFLLWRIIRIIWTRCGQDNLWELILYLFNFKQILPLTFVHNYFLHFVSKITMVENICYLNFQDLQVNLRSQSLQYVAILRPLIYLCFTLLFPLLKWKIDFTVSLNINDNTAFGMCLLIVNHPTIIIVIDIFENYKSYKINIWIYK